MEEGFCPRKDFGQRIPGTIRRHLPFYAIFYPIQPLPQEIQSGFKFPGDFPLPAAGVHAIVRPLQTVRESGQLFQGLIYVNVVKGFANKLCFEFLTPFFQNFKVFLNGHGHFPKNGHLAEVFSCHIEQDNPVFQLSKRDLCLVHITIFSEIGFGTHASSSMQFSVHLNGL